MDSFDGHPDRQVPKGSVHPPIPSEELFEKLYSELRSLAQSHMSRLSPGQTLQPTALIHEAFLKMHSSEWENERVFFHTAAMAMRSVVLDKIKAKGRLKRGGKNILITLNGLDPEDERAQSPSDILMVEEVLLEIKRLDPELKELLLLRYYTGMSFPRIAVLMGIPLRSLERRWQFIRAFVGREQARRTESDSHHGQ